MVPRAAATRPVPPTDARRVRWYAEEPPWWVRDVLVAGIIGSLLLLGQYRIDLQREDRESRQENLRFIRERAAEASPRIGPNGTALKSVLPYRDMDLRGLNLSGLDMRNADFTNSDLTGAVLRGADLSGATFRYTILDGAVLDDAILKGAEFSRVYVRGTDMKFWQFQPDDPCYDNETKWPQGYVLPTNLCEAAQK